MNRRTNSYGPMQKTRAYTGIILRLQKGRSRQLQLTIFTKESGILYVYAPKGKKGYNQGFGSFMVFSPITFDAWERDHVLFMGEYESQRSTILDALTWDYYVYTQMFVEMVLAIIPAGEPDERIYELIGCYSRAIASRNVRVATIIAGWQLTACAGYMPDTAAAQVYMGPGTDGRKTYYLSDEREDMQPVPLPSAVRQLWQTLLTYSWQKTDTIQLPRNQLAFLEHLLYSYVEELSGRQLKCRKLIEEGKKV